MCQCPDYHIPRFTDDDCTQCSAQFIGNTCTQCAEGWSGDMCQIDIDECEENENVCNNGICKNSPGSFECFCRPGFGGQYCDYDFPECLSGPCKHGGTCEDRINAFECFCAPGYEGMWWSSTDNVLTTGTLLFQIAKKRIKWMNLLNFHIFFLKWHWDGFENFYSM